eukprot:s3427_g2.t1
MSLPANRISYSSHDCFSPVARNAIDSTTVIHWRIACGRYDDGVRDAMFNVFEEEELVQDVPGVPKVPVHFVVVTPRPGQLDAVMETVQRHIIDPLVRRKILLEFHVRDATPESFVAQDWLKWDFCWWRQITDSWKALHASTLVVLEFVVPVPWPITDWDDWRRKLGPEMGLVVAPGIVRPEHLSEDGEASQRAKSALARAMVLPPAQVKRPPEKQTLWPSSCMDREKSTKELLW